MILLLGGSGYIGQAFVTELRQRNCPFYSLARSELDYTKLPLLLGYLRDQQPTLVINAAGFTGRPNVDACEDARAETLQGNTLFPQVVGFACETSGVALAHISSGCIYMGAKFAGDDGISIQTDLTTPEMVQVRQEHPERLLGFNEKDQPNFTWRHPPCSFYSASKALAEEALVGLSRCYLWRLRIPFDEYDDGRNYLSKLQRYPKVYDNVNSISHRGDFARACLDLWERKAPYGIYNVANPGFITARMVVKMIKEILNLDREFEFWQSDAEFYRQAARALRSNCLLDSSKLLSTGVRLRPVTEALEDALNHWKAKEVSA